MSDVNWGEIPANTTQGANEVMSNYPSTFGVSGSTWESIIMGVVHINLVIRAPSVGGAWITKVQQDLTVLRISSCIKSGTSATFNIEMHETADVSGTNIMSSDQAADTDGSSTTSFANASIPEGYWLFIDVSAISGSPTYLMVTIACSVG